MTAAQLEDWKVIDPELRQDQLPQPYRFIDQVLRETVLNKLDLALFELEKQTKNPNYEGSVPQYFSQNCLDLDVLSCLSAESNSHNQVMAGDKMGALYLLDLAKKTVFSKKDLIKNKRVTYIAQSLITDGQTTITTAAVILNRQPTIQIVRYKHGQQKIMHVFSVEVGSGGDLSSLPYACKWDDYSRLLLVFTMAGSILAYRIPEMVLDLDAINRNQRIPLEEEDFKKKLRYPLSYALLETEVKKISEPLLTIPFDGKKDGENPMTANKDEESGNGEDKSIGLTLPSFQPFALVVHSRVQLSKKKTFEKGIYINVPHRLIYGWKGTKQFKVAEMFPNDTSRIPEYIMVQHMQVKLQEKEQQLRREALDKKVELSQQRKLKTISPIQVAAISNPDQLYLGLGMANGTTAVWTTASLNLLMHTDKHTGPVSALAFFQGWKIITSSQTGSLHIDDLHSRHNILKRSHVFKHQSPVTHLRVSHLGLCLALDLSGQLRLYDLWRNEKIAKIQASNNFAKLENKNKRWLSGSTLPLYMNQDFIAVLSCHWPSFTSRELQDQPDKKQQLKELIDNPWISRNTQLHVIRNFQLLLNLFPGLEATYKRGYDRRKVENLFSNLQFPQLQDRAFEIPDFGGNPRERTIQPQASFKSSSHHPKSQTSTKSPFKETKGMTKEVLHPQQFLLERRKVTGLQVLTAEKLQDTLLKNMKRQDALENSLMNTLTKGPL